MTRDERRNTQSGDAKNVLLTVATATAWLLAYKSLHPVSYVGRTLYWLLLYVLGTAFFALLRHSKLGRFFFTIVSVPAVFFITVFPFLLAAASVVLSYTIIFFLSIVLFRVIPVQLFDYHPTKAVTIYLEITISSIVVAYFYDKVVGLLDYIIVHRGDTSKKRFSLRVLNQSRAKFSIYFLYFIALLVVHTTRFNGTPIIDSVDIEKAILESFGTFLAFERIISNWNLFIEEKGKQ